MAKVAIHPPKTPVTSGSSGIAKVTLPNVCKMPGPPAPFIPSPLPNIAKSGNSPKGYSKNVKIESNEVAIRGATFESMGDMASKATGGGLLSANAHGPAKFITPGSFTVKIEGSGVHLLGEPMLNNVGASGSPPNTGATMNGLKQADLTGEEVLKKIRDDCDKAVKPERKDGSKKTCTKLGSDKHACCENKVQKHRAENPPNGSPPVEGENGYPRPPLNSNNRPVGNADGSFPPLGNPLGPRPNMVRAFKMGGKAIGRGFAALKGNCYPDAAILHPDGSKQFVDFKFPCPPGHPTRRGAKNSQGGVKTGMNPRQLGSYDGLGAQSGNFLGSITL